MPESTTSTINRPRVADMTLAQANDLAEAWISQAKKTIEGHYWKVLNNKWTLDKGGTLHIQWQKDDESDSLFIRYKASDGDYNRLGRDERIKILVLSDIENKTRLRDEIIKNQKTPKENQEYYYDFTKIVAWYAA